MKKRRGGRVFLGREEEGGGWRHSIVAAVLAGAGPKAR